LTWIKAGNLYVKTKLLNVANHDTILLLIVITGVFFNTPEAKNIKERGRARKPSPIKVWFVGRV
jgi:hypothetical protein